MFPALFFAWPLLNFDLSSFSRTARPNANGLERQLEVLECLGPYLDRALLASDGSAILSQSGREMRWPRQDYASRIADAMRLT